MISYKPFSIRLELASELRCLLPNKWEDYLISTDYPCDEITLQLIVNEEFGEGNYSDGWTLIPSSVLNQVVYASDGKVCFSLAYDSRKNNATIIVREASERFIRNGMLYGMLVASNKSCIGFHGVTLLCGNNIVILSAPSGTGKTTLAKLLEKYCDAVVINGDFALLSPTEDGVIYEPTPFCGTSGRSLNHRFRVNRVVFLGQAKNNHWYTLDGREAMTRFMSNAFVPDWDSDMKQTVQENILKSISMLKVNAYDFAPTQEAAEEFLRRVEDD